MNTDTVVDSKAAEDKFLALLNRHENESAFSDGDWVYKQGVFLSEPFGWSFRSYDHTLELTGSGPSPTFGGKGYLGMDSRYLKSGTGYSWAYVAYLFGMYVGVYDGATNKFGRIIVWGLGAGLTGGGSLSINYTPQATAAGAPRQR
jgi:hypothetical protein